MDSADELDITALKTKGFVHIRDFFDEAMRDDLRKRASEILRARDAGVLTTDDQDAQGFEYEWFRPLVCHPGLIAVSQSLFGPDICAVGWRILIKDKHYRGGIPVHQDWPYNVGNTNKLTVFVPLTHIDQDNGGLFFYEESHFYGPVSMGPIDISRFPPMTSVCPELNVGDVVLCDYMMWHSSLAAVNDHDRIMLQLNYQPASDASSKNLIAGRMPHDRLLRNRWDAAGVPSVDMNVTMVRRLLARGETDRAERFARGMVADDPQHAGAALLLHDILAERGDPQAAVYLEKARGAAANTLNEVQNRIQERAWRPLELQWNSLLPGVDGGQRSPAALETPPDSWSYGAITDALPVGKPAAVRIRAASERGKISLSIGSEDLTADLSEHILLSPQDGEVDVVLAYDGAVPARICVRNYGDPGASGRVLIQSVHIQEAG